MGNGRSEGELLGNRSWAKNPTTSQTVLPILWWKTLLVFPQIHYFAMITSLTKSFLEGGTFGSCTSRKYPVHEIFFIQIAEVRCLQSIDHLDSEIVKKWLITLYYVEVAACYVRILIYFRCSSHELLKKMILLHLSAMPRPASKHTHAHHDFYSAMVP